MRAQELRPQNLGGRGLRPVWVCDTLNGQMQTRRARTPFLLLEQLPASLRDVTLSSWEPRPAVGFGSPVERVAIGDLRWHLAFADVGLRRRPVRSQPE